MAQKLDPKHKEMYERVMNTPTKKPAQAPKSEPKPEPKPASSAQPEQKSAFLSSMPIQPSKGLGVKTFTFKGGKKVTKEEHKKDEPKPATHETKAPSEKKKASKLIIVIFVIGFIALWGAFWAYILGFI